MLLQRRKLSLNVPQRLPLKSKRNLDTNFFCTLSCDNLISEHSSFEREKNDKDWVEVILVVDFHFECISRLFLFTLKMSLINLRNYFKPL